jgi:hypothetical protein
MQTWSSCPPTGGLPLPLLLLLLCMAYLFVRSEENLAEIFGCF